MCDAFVQDDLNTLVCHFFCLKHNSQPALISFFGHFGGRVKSCKHNTDILPHYKVAVANVWLNMCIFTYPAYTEQH